MSGASRDVHLFGFLGINRYVSGRYRYPEQSVLYQSGESPEVVYVQTALALGVGERLEAFTLFVTPTARVKHLEALQQEFAAHQLPTPLIVEITESLDQAAIYTLFAQLRDALLNASRGRTLAFDLTHGFRALPALGLMILNYVSALDPSLQVASIAYGAWEKDQHITPIIELAPLWELNQWASAFEAFQTEGHVSRLASLAQRQHDAFFSRPHPKDDIPKLNALSSALRDWEGAARHDHVPLLFGQGDGRDGLLVRLYKRAQEEWNQSTEEIGRFIAPLRERLEEMLAPMQSERWDDPRGLAAQLAWARWLVSVGRYSSALTVLREWVVTLLELADESYDDAENELQREDYERMLSSMNNLQAKKLDERLKAILSRIDDESFIKTVDALVTQRNGVNHAFIPKNAAAPKHKKAPNLREEIPAWIATFEAALHALSPKDA